MESKLNELAEKMGWTESDVNEFVKELINRMNSKHEENLDIRVTKILTDLGVSFNVIGFNYLRKAIKLVFENPSMVHYMTTKLYPTIADEYNTTSVCIERAIRNAIKKNWENGVTSTRVKYFGETVSQNGKPTNGEFIAAISEYLRLEMDL